MTRSSFQRPSDPRADLRSSPIVATTRAPSGTPSMMMALPASARTDAGSSNELSRRPEYVGGETRTTTVASGFASEPAPARLNASPATGRTTGATAPAGSQHNTSAHAA